MSNDGEKRFPKTAHASEIRHPGMHGKFAHATVVQPNACLCFPGYSSLTPLLQLPPPIVNTEDVMLGRGGEANSHRYVCLNRMERWGAGSSAIRVQLLNL